MNLAEIEPDSMALRLAEVVNRRVGLRPADAVRKVASSLAGVEDAHRLAYVERMIAASSNTPAASPRPNSSMTR